MHDRFLRRFLQVLTIVSILLLPCSAPGGVGKQEKEPTEKKLAYESIELLTEAMLQVKDKYVDEKTYEEIIHGALQGMMQSLDPHSSFLEVEAYQELREDSAGKFSGIGIHIGMRNGVLLVIAPIEDTPAFKAGLQAGDMIVEIDGEDTNGKSLRDAIRKLRGPKGEKVVVTIQRRDSEEKADIEIIRDEISVPSVKGARILKNNVGYVRITQFAKTTAVDLQKAIDELNEQGMTALVIDLRDNPGGLLKSSVQVSEKFIDKGLLVVSTKGRAKDHKEQKFKAAGDVHETKIPIAVLINSGSASASEIVAGALRDHERAILVGSLSYGKGSVQSIIKLDADGKSAIKLTTQYYYTPKGVKIHGEGLKPDIEIALTLKQWREIRLRRAHLENPTFYDDEAKAKYKDVVDDQLIRAVDALLAIRFFKK